MVHSVFELFKIGVGLSPSYTILRPRRWVGSGALH
jgi:hypothetical protein